MKRSSLAWLVGSSIVALLALWALLRPQSASEAAPAPTGTPASDEALALQSPSSAASAGRSALGQESDQDRAAPPVSPSLTDDALWRQLVLIARVEREVPRTEDPDPDLVKELEDALGPVILDRGMVEAVLSLLLSGTLRSQVVRPHAEGAEPAAPALSEVEYGAVVALQWSLIVWTGQTKTPGATAVGDPQVLLLDILGALPALDEPVRGLVVKMLTDARCDGALVLDASHLNEILSLRARLPEFAALYSALLKNMGEGMGPEQRDAFHALLLDGSADPTMAKIALSNLLQGSNPELALSIAQQMMDAASTSYDLREALRAAVAKAGPVREAAEFLARHDGTHGDYMNLGGRADALMALEEAYELRRLDGADPKTRVMLVFGMRKAEDARLFEIAETDPDSRVVGQAMLSLTARSTWQVDERPLELVRRIYTGSEESGVSHVAASGIAENLASKARAQGKLALQAKAVELMRFLALDPRASTKYRMKTAEQLRPFLTEAELADLVRQIQEE
jgi:hypothetical protein